MATKTAVTNVPATRQCHLCKHISDTEGDDLLIFGEWMLRGIVCVHYYCLLLSTNLPQRGGDTSGILGFFIRDIRKEINAASRRRCTYCHRWNASIQCYKCHIYMHIQCGYQNGALFQFFNEFRSYCDQCFPLDEHQRKTMADPPVNWTCAVCRSQMLVYKPHNWIHANCCGNGWAHRICLQGYALSAGYYLRCLWCGDIKFRDMVRQLGIFVPDCDATWELQTHAYSDLYRGHERCDVEACLCRKGREYKLPNTKWRLLLCKMCGSFGAHFGCLSSKQKHQSDEFCCTVCQLIQTAKNKEKGSTPVGGADLREGDKVNQAHYMHKVQVQQQPNTLNDEDCITFSSESIEQNLTPVERTTPVIVSFAPNNNTIPILSTGQKKDHVPLVETKVEPPEDAEITPGNRYHVFNALILFNFNCQGTATFCIDRLDARFVGLPVEEIEKSNLIDVERDIISRSNNRGIFDIIDRIIASKSY